MSVPLVLRRRDRRAAERQQRKSEKNPWDRPLPGVNEDDPHSVQAALKDRLVGLAQLRQHIRADDAELYRQAQAMHDHHRDHAEQLAEEVRRAGPGADPLLENAHAHHLAARQVAEETMAKLRERVHG